MADREYKQIPVGSRFGILTVVGPGERIPVPNTKYFTSTTICQCECRKTTTFTNSNLRSAKSCGCTRARGRKFAPIGQKFGRWTVVSDAPFVSRAHSLCRCECGTEREVLCKYLFAGTSQSCGCRQADITADRNTTHGLRHTPEYGVWAGIKSRCYRESDEFYADYGGRGITVCERWRDSFENFLADMGERPSPKHSIDRKEVNGNNEPDNCRWATPTEQARNKRNNRNIEFRGETKCLTAWCEQYGFDHKTVSDRLDRGETIGQALNLEPHPKRRAPRIKTAAEATPLEACWTNRHTTSES